MMDPEPLTADQSVICRTVSCQPRLDPATGNTRNTSLLTNCTTDVEDETSGLETGEMDEDMLQACSLL